MSELYHTLQIRNLQFIINGFKTDDICQALDGISSDMNRMTCYTG